MLMKAGKRTCAPLSRCVPTVRLFGARSKIRGTRVTRRSNSRVLARRTHNRPHVMQDTTLACSRARGFRRVAVIVVVPFCEGNVLRSLSLRHVIPPSPSCIPRGRTKDTLSRKTRSRAAGTFNDSNEYFFSFLFLNLVSKRIRMPRVMKVRGSSRPLSARRVSFVFFERSAGPPKTFPSRGIFKLFIRARSPIYVRAVRTARSVSRYT